MMLNTEFDALSLWCDVTSVINERAEDRNMSEAVNRFNLVESSFKSGVG